MKTITCDGDLVGRFVARELGITVSRLESEMSGIELLEWMAFFKMEKEERDKAELAMKANQGVDKAKARPRRGE